jgi:glucan phosphoethanolaminetransferase (alkaline phosphatase superfamily)
MRKSVVLVSLELLVLQIGTYMICHGDIANLLETQNIQHPLLTISLICLILLCMILLCVFSVLMLVHLLPKRHAKDAKA